MDISYSTKRILPISSPKLVNETRHQHGGLRVAKYDKRVCKKEKEGELIVYFCIRPSIAADSSDTPYCPSIN